MTALVVGLTILAPLAGPAGAVGTFDDDDGNIHEANIEKIASLGITKGCNPPTNNFYCPDDYVTREQMASFLVRALELEPAPASQFTDTSASVHRSDIDALAASGITKGCNPPANTEYCPTDLVTRGQMAAFMARGLGLANEDENYFIDDDNSIFEAQIDAIARIGITKGCNPPQNDQYCPDRPVRRDEMASFLSRVADIHTTGTTVINPPSTTPGTTPPTSTPPTTLVPDGPCYTTVPAEAEIVGNPLINDFAPDGGLCDKGEDGTGFLTVSKPSNSSDADGYIRSLLDITGGHLNITTTAGLFDTSLNNQDNALAIGLNPQVTYTIETEIDNPPAGTGGFEQGGLWWGNDEDNYIKVVYISNAGGPAVQIRGESAGAIIAGSTTTVGLGSVPASVELRLTADLSNQTVQGWYRVNNTGSFTSIGTVSNVPVAFWTIDQAGTTTNTFAGLMASHRNGPAPVTFSFDRFTADGVLSTIACATANGMECEKTAIGYKPTSFEYHGGKLYVLSVTGSVYRYVVNSDGSLSPDGVHTKLPSAPAGTTYTALGMAIQPGSSNTNPTVWIATSRSGGPNYLEGVANSSTVWRIENLVSDSTTTAMITGLPRAYENHAINSIHFKDGHLYIAQGGNTGGGSANGQSGSAFGTRAEQPLSAAWLRANNILDGWNVANEGTCATGVDDGPPPNNAEAIPTSCDLDILATGLRNTYDFVFHSNGNVYGADNGLGVVGTVPATPTAPCGDYIPAGDVEEFDPGSQPDRLQILDEGNYYGHPNPTRDECVFFNGNFQGVSPDPDYVPAHQILNTAEGSSPRSLNSIIEYDAGGASSTASWDGDLLITAFAGSTQGVFKYDPVAGCANQGGSAFGQGCFSRVGPALGAPLGIEQLPNGRLAVGEWVARTNNESQFIVIFTPTS